MKRLTKKYRNSYTFTDSTGTFDTHNTDTFYKLVQETLQKLAHYEDLEENGRLIELPISIGGKVMDKVTGVCCLNTNCKHFYEDNCMRIFEEKTVDISENGQCENYEKGEYVGYSDDKKNLMSIADIIPDRNLLYSIVDKINKERERDDMLWEKYANKDDATDKAVHKARNSVYDLVIGIINKEAEINKYD